MKKSIFFFVLLFFIGLGNDMNAQGVTLEGLNIGAFIGPNLTFPSVEITPDDPSDDVSGGVGVEGGVIVDYGLNPYLGVQSGLIVSTRGYKRKTEVENPVNAADQVALGSNQNLTTLSIPLTARVRPGSTISKVSVFGTLGIIPEFNVSYRNRLDSIFVEVDAISGVETLQIAQIDRKSSDNFNIFTMSGQVGLGVLFGGAFVKGTFNFALINAVEATGLLDLEEKAKLHYATLSVGYFF